MLRQLARLSVEADGRYATPEELQFLKDYLQSLEMRVSAYEKIQSAEEKIIYLVEAKKRSLNANLFQLSSQDVTQVCRRDLVNVLRYAAAALLINDFDRLRDGILLWCQTIVRTFKYKRYAEVTYQVIQDVVKQHLTPEEAALFYPFLELNHIILSK
jgi:hypothetical protein